MFFLASQIEQRAVLFIYFPKQLLGDLSFIDWNPLASKWTYRKEEKTEQTERDGGGGNFEGDPYLTDL